MGRKVIKIDVIVAFVEPIPDPLSYDVHDG